MLRALFVSTVILVATTAPALAGPTLANDLETCRNRQPDPQTRLAACENLIAAGQLTGKDLGTALTVRGNGFFTKGQNDKAIEAFSAALNADPGNFGIFSSRGWAYERKPIVTEPWPRISSAPRRKCGALRSIRGTPNYTTTLSRFAARVMPV